MSSMQAAAWPIIREDLTLYPGPADVNGAPTWTIHDPARNKYFQIDWLSFEVISRMALANAHDIAQAISAQTTLHADETSIQAVLNFLHENELLIPQSIAEIAALEKKSKLRSKGWIKTILHGYLFFRVPLVNPDRALERIVRWTSFIFSQRFLQITAVALLVGLWQVYRQWQSFATTLIDTFSFSGLIGYAGALICIKVAHEFGHAVVAKRHGCRVPAMGIAFLVMWPMAYTDVTESWKLKSNRERLKVASAGIVTELIVAVWAIFLWGILPEGPVKSACFFLGTTSLAATIAINASPFMRFDGYFLLSDILGMPNLHQRSFAYGRWWIREKLFHFGDFMPETLSAGQQKFFLIFAIATWVYRLILFTGIALLVYHFFFKALGVILFLVEIWFFILQPIVRELQVWKKRWAEIGLVIERQPAFYIGALLILVLVIPFDVTVNTQGVLKPENSFSVVSAMPSQITQLPPNLGSKVKSGDLLIGLDSPELAKRISRVTVRVESLKRQVSGASFDQKLLSQLPILRGQLQSAQEELAGLTLEFERLQPKTPFTGVVVDRQPDLFIGEWIPKAYPLVTVIDERNWVVDCYVEESELKRIDQGNWGRFIPDGQGIGSFRVEVIRIDRDATRILTEGSLASIAGGDVMVRYKDNQLIPERSIYRIRLKVTGNPETLSTGYLRGRVTMLAWPKSILGDFIRGLAATLVREFTF